VADQTSGIELMRRRMERASRRPPPPRRAPEGAAPAASGEAGPEGAGAGAPKAAGPSAPAPTRRPRPPRAAAPPPGRLAPDLPAANLAIRVRKPLDDRLAELIHALRREGVRTSKVELIEMLLWELPEDDVAGARERLRRFRAVAPRGPGAPLEEG
jgi:hypothetical protein